MFGWNWLFCSVLIVSGLWIWLRVVEGEWGVANATLLRYELRKTAHDSITVKNAKLR